MCSFNQSHPSSQPRHHRQTNMTGATAKSAFTTGPTFEDPYTYQVGFGNSFASEAVPNVLPRGMNAPQKVKYDLYSEQLNGSSLVAPRQQIQHVWMYRIRPSVAHGAVSVSDLNSHVESCFSAANENVKFVAAQKPGTLSHCCQNTMSRLRDMGPILSKGSEL